MKKIITVAILIFGEVITSFAQVPTPLCWCGFAISALNIQSISYPKILFSATLKLPPTGIFK
jgi:hypothetical protein